MVVLAFSFPVILIDEALKLVGRYRQAAALALPAEHDGARVARVGKA